MLNRTTIIRIAALKNTAAQFLPSTATFTITFVNSVGTMFGADPPSWAYGFEGPPQAGATPTPDRSGYVRWCEAHLFLSNEPDVLREIRGFLADTHQWLAAPIVLD